MTPRGPAWIISVTIAASILLPRAWGGPWSPGHREKREAFLGELSRKSSLPVGGRSDIRAVLYDSDTGRFAFSMSDGDRRRLSDLLRDFFAVDDDRTLAALEDRLASGRIIVSRTYRKKGEGTVGAQMRACLLIPPVPYYPRIATVEGAEETFSVYNVTVSFTEEDTSPVIIGFFQPEGEFLGISRAVNVPVRAQRQPEDHAVIYTTPTQAEMDAALAHIRSTSSPDKDPERGFINMLRRHPYFAEHTPDGSYRVSDADIIAIRTQLTDLADACPISDLRASWRVHEVFSTFHEVEYTLESTANVRALVPDIPLLTSIVGHLAQGISDVVSWKYLSLSMKNLRDAVVLDSGR